MSLMCLARLEFSLFLYFNSALSTEESKVSRVSGLQCSFGNLGVVRDARTYTIAKMTISDVDFLCETLFMYVLRAQRGP